jgi:hypothetical protein
MTSVQKSTEQMLNEKVFPAIILVLSVVAFILYFVEDFAGWYQAPSSYRYVWMFSEYHPWSFVFLLPLAAAFVFIGFTSVMTLLKPDSKWAGKDNLNFLISVEIVAITIISGIVFNIVLAVWDPTDWWLSTNFYSGLVAGGLNGLFSYLILRGRGEKIRFRIRT